MTGNSEIGTQAYDRTVDLASFFDPGRREPIDAEQMVRHPLGRIFKRVAIEVDGPAFVGQVVEFTGLDRFPDLAFSDGFKTVHAFSQAQHRQECLCYM